MYILKLLLITFKKNVYTHPSTDKVAWDSNNKKQTIIPIEDKLTHKS